jgi:sortase (surface protein transpeptidase)
MTPPSAALKYFLKKKNRKKKKRKEKKKKRKKRKEKRKRKKKKKRKKTKKKEKEKNKEKKGVFRAELYPPGIESRNTTPHAINGLVEVKKASFPPSSMTPCVLAHTGSRARNNGCALVACVQS